jgi:ribosomal protein L40E
MSSFGVDTLGGLTEKLKQLINDTQNAYETLIDSTQRYKQGKMNEKEYFSSIGKYLIASSAMNFLAIKVILEIKSAIDKGSSIKNPTGGIADPNSNTSSSVGFGIGGFVGAGGSVGSVGGLEGSRIHGGSSSQQQYSSPSIEPALKPVDIEIEKRSQDITTSEGYALKDNKQFKNCIVCGVLIPTKAKFCSKCGNSQ